MRDMREQVYNQAALKNLDERPFYVQVTFNRPHELFSKKGYATLHGADCLLLDVFGSLK